MHENRTQRHVRCALIAIVLGFQAGAAAAGSFTLSCAARDRQVLMLIEQRADAVPQQTLIDALNTMMNARMTCHEGRVLDALSIYDGIAEGFATHSPDFGQRP